MSHHGLSYEEKRLLRGYHYFLQGVYHEDTVNCMCAMQNMAYFLQKKGWLRTDFEFFMSPHGMHSAGLETVLLRWEHKRDAVRAFQANNVEIEGLSLHDWKWIHNLFDLFMMGHHQKDKTEWITALASALYVKDVLLPGCSPEVIVQRVKEVVVLLPWKTAKEAALLL